MSRIYPTGRIYVFRAVPETDSEISRVRPRKHQKNNPVVHSRTRRVDSRDGGASANERATSKSPPTRSASRAKNRGGSVSRRASSRRSIDWLSRGYSRFRRHSPPAPSREKIVSEHDGVVLINMAFNYSPDFPEWCLIQNEGKQVREYHDGEACHIYSSVCYRNIPHDPEWSIYGNI